LSLSYFCCNVKEDEDPWTGCAAINGNDVEKAFYSSLLLPSHKHTESTSLYANASFITLITLHLSKSKKTKKNMLNESGNSYVTQAQGA
jgi:hypothetical protein